MRQEWVGKRTALRQPCAIRAEICPHDGKPSFPCTIVEISGTGARITIAEGDVLPDIFDLHIAIRSETKPARIVRRHPGFIAIAFLKPREADRMMIASLMDRVIELEAHACNQQPIQPADPLHDVTQRLAAVEEQMSRIAAQLSGDREVVDALLVKIEAAEDRLNGIGSNQAELGARLTLVEQSVSRDPWPEIAAAQAMIASLQEQIASRVGDAEMQTIHENLQREIADGLDSLRRSLPSVPHDPTQEILSLRHEFNELLEQLTCQVPAAAKRAPLAAAVEQLHHTMASLAPRSELEDLRQQVAGLKGAAQNVPASPSADIIREVASLRSSVQALIILVSKSMARARDAA